LKLVAALVVFLSADPCFGQAAPKQSDVRLKQFLQMYLKDPRGRTDSTTRYAFKHVDLDGDDEEETIVYLTGGGWCGSGGCTLLVLEAIGSSYSVIGRTTIVHMPIRVLQTRTNGWRDLGVWVAGGGRPGYEAVLPFDGRTYASNPSVPPAHPVRALAAGDLLFALDTEGKPLD
jgi:hypothetical protein